MDSKSQLQRFGTKEKTYLKKLPLFGWVITVRNSENLHIQVGRYTMIYYHFARCPHVNQRKIPWRNFPSADWSRAWSMCFLWVFARESFMPSVLLSRLFNLKMEGSLSLEIGSWLWWTRNSRGHDLLGVPEGNPIGAPPTMGLRNPNSQGRLGGLGLPWKNPRALCPIFGELLKSIHRGIF